MMGSLLSIGLAALVGAVFGAVGLQPPVPDTFTPGCCVIAMTAGYLLVRRFF